MAAADGEKKMITLKSSDDEEFKVEEAVAMESQIIRHMIEDDCADNAIPLPNVNSKILSKVIEYCNKHVLAAKPADGAAASGAAAAGDAPAPPAEDLKNWDAEFVKVDQATLFDLMLAANYLNIKGLLELTCQTVANMCKGMTVEEIRKTLNINNFTPEEEEEEIRRENQWAFVESSPSRLLRFESSASRLLRCLSPLLLVCCACCANAMITYLAVIILEST